MIVTERIDSCLANHGEMIDVDGIATSALFRVHPEPDALGVLTWTALVSSSAVVTMGSAVIRSSAVLEVVRIDEVKLDDTVVALWLLLQA